MANRPVFIPKEEDVGVEERPIEFSWSPGMATSQKQKSIRSLHDSANKIGLSPTLEISSKSEEEFGISLSAFNLSIVTKKHKRKMTIETAFQGSKVFENGGPYTDLYGTNSLLSKRDIRLKESGNMISFMFFGKSFPLEPRTFFYDWIYINALNQDAEKIKKLEKYNSFTDIEFNPKKSINCQAHSAALCISLLRNNLLTEALSSPDNFLIICKKHYEKQKREVAIQTSLA